MQRDFTLKLLSLTKELMKPNSILLGIRNRTIAIKLSRLGGLVS